MIQTKAAMRSAPLTASSPTFSNASSIYARFFTVPGGVPVRRLSLISLTPKSSKALNSTIHITWYWASLAKHETVYKSQSRKSARGLHFRWNRKTHCNKIPSFVVGFWDAHAGKILFSPDPERRSKCAHRLKWDTICVRYWSPQLP